MNPWITVLILTLILAAILGVLFYLGKRNLKKQEEAEAQIMSAKQTISMLMIDKKKMRLKDAGLPQQIVDSVPRYLRWQKLPIVKAKIGPNIMTLIADAKIYDQIPLKKEVKADVSGIYIIGVRGIRGKNLPKEEVKKGFFQKAMDTLREKGSAKPL